MVQRVTQNDRNVRRPLATTAGEYMKNRGSRTYDETDKVSDSEQKHKRHMPAYHDQDFYPHMGIQDTKGRMHNRENQVIGTKHLIVGQSGTGRGSFFEIWYDDPQRLNDYGGTTSPTTGCYRAVFRDKNGNQMMEISPDNGIMIQANGKNVDLCAALESLIAAGLI